MLDYFYFQWLWLGSFSIYAILTRIIQITTILIRLPTIASITSITDQIPKTDIATLLLPRVTVAISLALQKYGKFIAILPISTCVNSIAIFSSLWLDGSSIVVPEVLALGIQWRDIFLIFLYSSEWDFVGGINKIVLIILISKEVGLVLGDFFSDLLEIYIPLLH